MRVLHGVEQAVAGNTGEQTRGSIHVLIWQIWNSRSGVVMSANDSKILIRFDRRKVSGWEITRRVQPASDR
ncbi:MAG TPA: hypothetical protein VGA55_02855, partial [Bacteroidota bacterium]